VITAARDVVVEGRAQLLDRIDRLRRERNAVILAHNYQRPEVQDIADFVGDSLGLSQQAAATDASVIVFCGVHFMAETAAILSPDKTVLLPDLEAGCSLAATIDAEQLRAWRSQHPGAVVVSYVNTTAQVKALSDYCCTSSNAEAVIRSIPADREILFCPDMFLGAHLERVNPHAELLIHPECGCTSSTLYRMSSGDLAGPATVVTSTEGMVRRAAASDASTFIVATEVGILHRMRRDSPGKRFLAASEAAVCPYMKKITLDKVARSLEHLAPRVTVDPAVAAQARGAIDRMLAIAPSGAALMAASA
jgi:quinolinate synthase